MRLEPKTILKKKELAPKTSDKKALENPKRLKEQKGLKKEQPGKARQKSGTL